MTARILSVVAGGAALTLVALAVAAHAADDQQQPVKDPSPVPSVLNRDPRKKEYPFISIAPRLEYEKKRAATEEPTLTDETKARLKDVESRANLSYALNPRMRALHSIHNDEVNGFTKRPGNGAVRMIVPPLMSLALPPSGSIPFAPAPVKEPNIGPDVELPKTMTRAGAAAAPGLPSLDRLATFHTDGVFDFVNFARLGLVRNRERVAGFLSHEFVARPKLDIRVMAEDAEPREKWNVRRLELVSLLKHENPGVYLSESLPRMDELKSARLRNLTAFETKALKALREGEDIHIEANLNQIRMVGSVRASNTCLKCHDVKRGELLGAFTYLLQRDPPAEAK